MTQKTTSLTNSKTQHTRLRESASNNTYWILQQRTSSTKRKGKGAGKVEQNRTRGGRIDAGGFCSGDKTNGARGFAAMFVESKKGRLICSERREEGKEIGR